MHTRTVPLRLTYKAAIGNRRPIGSLTLQQQRLDDSLAPCVPAYRRMWWALERPLWVPLGLAERPMYSHVLERWMV